MNARCVIGIGLKHPWSIVERSSSRKWAALDFIAVNYEAAEHLVFKTMSQWGYGQATNRPAFAVRISDSDLIAFNC
jgi:hypothetical protein